MVKIALLLIFCTSLSAQAGLNEWNLNDISYLYSLPKLASQTPEHLMTPQDSESNGALLPLEVYKYVPNVVAGSGNIRIYEKNLKVIGVRVDPCPSFDKNNCGPAEVRMIWQPVEYDKDFNAWHGRDGAVHSFYHLGKKEMNSLLKELWNLKLKNQSNGINTKKLPLNIHPAMSDKKFVKQLNKTFLKYCGKKNLKKVTFMSLLVATRWWRFGSLELQSDGTWMRVQIPRTDLKFIDIFNTASEGRPANNIPGKAMDAMFNIFAEDYPQRDIIFPIINNSYRQNNDSDKEVFASKLDAIYRFRNPHRTNPGTLDCASCHFADPALFYATRRFPDLAQITSEDKYLNPAPKLFNLENTTIAKKATRIVRAFGYFGDKAAINQRTINESAAVSHWLNSRK